MFYQSENLKFLSGYTFLRKYHIDVDAHLNLNEQQSAHSTKSYVWTPYHIGHKSNLVQLTLSL